MLINLLHQINFRLIAEALKRDYPSKFASKTMVQNQNEFVKMQSLVAAYDAGLEARSVSLCHKLFPCAKLPKFESEIAMDSRCEIFVYFLLLFPQNERKIY